MDDYVDVAMVHDNGLMSKYVARLYDLLLQEANHRREWAGVRARRLSLIAEYGSDLYGGDSVRYMAAWRRENGYIDSAQTRMGEYLKPQISHLCAMLRDFEVKD